MGASFEESVIALKSMFPDVSEVVVRTTLEARDGHMESAVEKLLAMSRRGGGGHGGKDYGQSGLGAPGRSEERRVGKECRSRWSPYH